jgi:leucyl aminopeptidase
VSGSRAGKSSGIASYNTANILLTKDSRVKTSPIWLAWRETLADDLRELTSTQRSWLHSIGWQAGRGNIALLPADNGSQFAGAILGMGDNPGKHTPKRDSMLAAKLAKELPAGAYEFTRIPGENPQLAGVFWLLASYKFSRYLQKTGNQKKHLRLPDDCDIKAAVQIAEAVMLGRDLINTPAIDMGPEELAAAACKLANAHLAEMDVLGDSDLLAREFPLLHTVGRASDRPPRLIDLRWGKEDAPKVTLVGKGICFDTGGLNLKPGNAMLLMKKDMGGAAAVLSLGKMIMDAKLPVRLRILIPAADNNVSGNSFRPGDVITSRCGISVEIGNTDAEGRLVLADALSLADEEKPDYLINMATLTGAARVAVGAEISPFFTDNDKLARKIEKSSRKVLDPVWRLPLWKPYRTHLNSQIADLNNVSSDSFAGSISAALFLQRFVRNAKHFVHFDIYGWVPSARPGFPKGGEPQAARTLFAMLQKQFQANE